MTSARSWLATWLPVLLGDDEALVGDLLEEYPRRSRGWLVRQVLFVLSRRVVTSASAAVREPQRLGEVLTALGLLGVLGFQAVVAGSLLDGLAIQFGRALRPWFDGPAGFVSVALLSVPGAWATGRLAAGLHPHSRVATVLLCGVMSAAVAVVDLAALGSDAAGFLPAGALQTAMAIVFVVGILAGASSYRVRAQSA